MRFRPGAQSGRICLGLVVTILSTASCAPAPDRARHTVVEYAKDAALRHRQMALCTNDPGTVGRSADCINAREAERAASVGSLRTLPPLKLPDNKEVKYMGFFATFSAWLDGMLSTYIGTNTAKIATLLGPAILALATGYVMIWGYLQITGKIEEPVVGGS